jgi:zinc transport system substrate-binding protein
VIYTVNYPLQYFAERIGGPDVEVVMPAPPDEDPAYWKPDGDTLADYQQADLILMNGAGYAKWADSVSLPASRVVDTSAGSAEALIDLEQEVSHTHGPDGEHAHAGKAFTTWLDLALAREQAERIKEAMAGRWPERAAAFEAGFQALAQDLQRLDQELNEAVPDDNTVRVVYSHPVYQYFARAYGLEGDSVHFEPDQEPSPEQWKDLEAMLAARPAAFMVWEGEPLPAVAARLEDMGLASVVFDPAGNVPEASDFLAVMRDNARRLREALTGEQ